jgi:adenylate kinase family enzyme
VNIVIIGLYGSGKSTLAKVLSDKYGLKIISSIVFRQYLAENNIEYSFDKGQQPPPIIFADFIAKVCVGKSGFVFDNIYTIEGFNAVNKYCKIDKYIYLEIDEKTAKQRVLLRNRPDCGNEFFKRRSQTFNESIIVFKKALGDKLLTFDATLPIEKLHEQVLYCIENR